jgi:hypothetical protein
MLGNCAFDICQLYNGLLLGIIASVIAAFIVLYVENYRRKKDLRQKYGKAAGNYLGYGFEISGARWTLKEKPQSEATITYIKDNILNIELTEYPFKGQYKWTGIITMDLETYGTVAWNYEIIDGQSVGGKKHEFGFKRIMIKNIGNKIYIYLVDEDRERYGKEILVKKE